MSTSSSYLIQLSNLVSHKQLIPVLKLIFHLVCCIRSPFKWVTHIWVVPPGVSHASVHRPRQIDLPT